MINQLLQLWEIKENPQSAIPLQKITIQLNSSKTNYTNKIPHTRIEENSLFQIFNVIHTHITDDQPTFTIRENQGTSMISNVFMEKDDHTFTFILNILHQKISIPKLRENSLILIFKVTHTDMTDDQPNFTIMENQGKFVISNATREKMTIHYFSLKTKPKLRGKSPSQVCNVTHTHIINDQPTFAMMENQEITIH